eukprot:235178-Chlamydomonas_euryale.AAC.5
MCTYISVSVSACACVMPAMLGQSNTHKHNLAVPAKHGRSCTASHALSTMNDQPYTASHALSTMQINHACAACIPPSWCAAADTFHILTWCRGVICRCPARRWYMSRSAMPWKRGRHNTQQQARVGAAVGGRAQQAVAGSSRQGRAQQAGCGRRMK